MSSQSCVSFILFASTAPARFLWWSSPGNLIAAAVVVGLAASPLRAQEKTLAELLVHLPADVAADVRQHVAQRADSPVDANQRAALLEELRAKHLGPVPSTARATGSVVASARCVAGYVVLGTYRVSAADVQIVEEQRRDCDAGGCRAFQVIAKRENASPFELDVTVTCAG